MAEKNQKRVDQTQINFDEINLTSDEQRAWEILRHRAGKEAALLGPKVAEATGLPYTEVRAIISHLVTDHQKLIASCGRGYYIPQTPEEIIEATKSLRHRGIMILRRAAKLQNTSLEDVFGQSRIEFSSELGVQS
jgi:hydroxymethylpyrimidine pyrophosphatase-like HAD family hydrolase